MLEGRLKKWQPRQLKQSKNKQVSNREEYIPDYINLNDSPSYQNQKESNDTMTKEEI